MHPVQILGSRRVQSPQAPQPGKKGFKLAGVGTMKPKPTLLANDFMKPWWMKNKKRLVAYKEYIEANERAKCEAEIVEDKIIIKEYYLVLMADNQRLTEELVKLKDVISKGTDMKVELLKENAKLKELLKEAEKWVCEKCAVCDHIRCERYEWLTKQKLWSGSQKPSKH